MLKPLMIRWGAAFLLVMATYNPTSLNYVRWAAANADTSLPMVLLFGLLLMVCYIIFLRATLRSIGPIGIALLLALVGAFLWVLYDAGLLSVDNAGVMTWIGLLVASFILGVGVSWSIIRRRITGQLDVDDVESSAD